nr:T9SS type A sorting domain-containing protein [Hymenobacter terricola]
MQNAGTLLSTERAAEAAGFDVFPNPATSELRVRLPLGATARQLRLYDALGRPVRAYAEAGPAAALSLRGLPAGLYVLRGTLAGQEVSRRVVVQ